MFRPGLNARCRARLGTGIVAHNNSAELRNVQIRGTSEGLQQWQYYRSLTLERIAPEATMRAREAFLGVVASGNLRRQQSGAMLASVPSLSPANAKQSTSNHSSDSHARNPSEDIMESSADSDASSESSTMSDGDSVNIYDSQHLVRNTSGASMVTESYLVEAKERGAKVRPASGSMLEENEGENEVDEDVNVRPESPARNSDLDTHSVQREPESGATIWTDDKHSSFLNSMEATFVRSLYNQQGLDHLGVYGTSAQIYDSEQDCVESRPVDAYGCCTSHPTELFELMQGGGQHQKSYYKPHGLDPPPVTTTKAVLANPWVRHFKQKILKSEYASNLPSTSPAEVNATPVKVVAVDVSQTNVDNFKREQSTIGAITAKDNNDVVEEEDQSGGASEDIDNKKETHSCVQVSEIEWSLRLWQNRLQIGGQAVINPSSTRKDMASWVLKRPSTFDTENADIFMAKRIKSTQQELAQKDLEMLEQYVAKQQAAGEQSEQAILEHARKAVERSADEEAGPSSASPEQKDARKVAGRSAMDQVVPLLGRMDSYESRSSLSFPDLNAPFHPSTGAAAACVVTIESAPEGRDKRTLPLVPDLNATPRISVASAYTTNQPTINFITKDGEAVAAAWSPRPEVGCTEENCFYELAGASYQAEGCEGDGGGNNNNTVSLELQTGECEPQLSPISNSRTWTWGFGGLRRRLHDTVGVQQSAQQPSRSLRDGILHFSDPVPFRSSGQQV